MAAIALGAAGAAAGWGMGGMIGAQIGWLVGSTLGSALFAPRGPHTDVQGPRLSDLGVQSSAYGQVLPKMYGFGRAAGNVIWSTAIIETATSSTTSSGGKGGGGASQTTTTYSYSVSFAVAIASYPITGIRRIWADGTLIYDIGLGLQTLAPVITGVSSCVVYPGNGSQTADPTIQAAEGAGNTPAFRNTAYIVFTGMQLANYGNRVPNITVEVTPPAPSGYDTLAQTSTSGVYARFGSAGVYTYSGGLVNVETYSFSAFSASKNKGTYDPATGVEQTYTSGITLPVPGGGFGSTYPPVVTNVSYIISDSQHWEQANTGVRSGAATNVFATYGLSSIVGLFYTGSGYLCVWSDGANTTVHVSAFGVSSTLPGDTATADSTMTGSTNTTSCYYDGTHLWVSSHAVASPGSATVKKFDNSGALVQSWTFSSQWTSGAPLTMYAIDGAGTVGDALYLGKNSSNGSKLWNLPIGGGAAVVVSTPTVQLQASAFLNDALATGVVFSAANIMLLSMSVPGTLYLSDVVSSICTQCGLSTGDIDVSLLASTVVRGFSIASMTNGRDAIQLLQQGFFFDQIETNGKIKFVPRGLASVASLTDDDLGGYMYSGKVGDPPDVLTITRKQELDMPRRIIVGFSNYDTDYQAGSQGQGRLITQASSVVNTTLPIVFTDDEAANVAAKLLYNEWLARETAQSVSSLKYLYLDPADVITVVSASLGATFTYRVLDTQFQPPGGAIQLNLCTEDAAIYNQSVSTANGGSTDQSVPVPGNSKLAIMDLPLLRDDDSDAGWYEAVDGAATDWNSATTFQSTDGGGTYAIDNFFPKTGIQGVSVNALGTFLASSNVFDLYHVLTVTLDRADMALANATDAELYAGANSFCLGNEVIQFGVAVNTTGSTWKLSRLLRNRKGSEGTQGSTAHTIGERFVMMSGGTSFRASRDTSYIGLALKIKPVTTNQLLSAATAVDFTPAGNALKPLSPVQIGGGRSAAGDLTINWARRNRIAAEWRNLVDVPQSEDTLQFSIDILSAPGGTLKRTINLTFASVADTLTTVYTAAQQTADFGSTQSSISMVIYQISSLIGRGFPGTATV